MGSAVRVCLFFCNGNLFSFYLSMFIFHSNISAIKDMLYMAETIS